MKGQAARSIVTVSCCIGKKIGKEGTNDGKSFVTSEQIISMVYATTSPFTCSQFHIVFLRCSASSRLGPSHQSLVAKQSRPEGVEKAMRGTA
jgi:hypothetical protein